MATATSGNVGGINFGIGTYTDNASIDNTFGKLESRLQQEEATINSRAVDRQVRMSEAARRAIETNEATGTAHRAGKIGGRIQEFGRGFEDFFVSFSMAKNNIDGIAMGLRGSANNAAQLASSFHPIAGAAVAIGASLATIIIPMAARWLWDTEKLDKEMKRVEDTVLGIGKGMAAAARAGVELADAGGKAADKRLVEMVDKTALEAKALQAEANRLKDAIPDAKQGWFGAQTDPARAKAIEAQQIKQQAADDKKAELHELLTNRSGEAERRELRATEQEEQNALARVESARKKLHADWTEQNRAVFHQRVVELGNAEKATVAAKARLKEIGDSDYTEYKKAAARKAEVDRQEAAAKMDGKNLGTALFLENWKKESDARKKAEKSLQHELDRGTTSSTKQKTDDIQREYDEMREKIEAGTTAPEVKAKQRMQALEAFQNKMRLEGDRQIKEQFNAEVQAKAQLLDLEIRNNADVIDSLQEQVQQAGNAAGPSPALLKGTQAAEQVISRALAGTRSQEDIMKAQLKAQQDILKQLQKQKQTLTASIVS